MGHGWVFIHTIFLPSVQCLENWTCGVNPLTHNVSPHCLKMTEDSPSNCPKEKPRSHMALSNLGLEVKQHNSVPFTKLVVKTSWCQGSQTETPPHDRRDIKAIQDRFFKTTQSQRHKETSSCLSWLLRNNFFFFLPVPKEKVLSSQKK